MKSLYSIRTLVPGILFSLALLPACEQAIPVDEQKREKVAILATREEFDGETRASTTYTSWSAGASINVFSDSGDNQKFSTDEYGYSVHFHGELTGQPVAAFSPYQESAKMKGNSIEFELPVVREIQCPNGYPVDDYSVNSPAFSKIVEKEAVFKHVCGLLVFVVQAGVATIQRAVLSSLEGEMLGGTFSVNLDGDGAATYVGSGADSLVINCVPECALPYSWSMQHSVVFGFRIPVGTLSGGFRFDLVDSDGRVFSLQTSKDNSVLRSERKNMPSVFVDFNHKPVMPDVLYVDIGLPVKWATCNLGAETPLDPGAYYAWGELEEKESYTWENYKFFLDNFGVVRFTKYVTTLHSGENMDSKSRLDPEDDAATQSLGSGWRIPTQDDFVEAQKLSTWLVTGNYLGTGVPGVVFVSDAPGYEGNYGFIPAGGVKGTSQSNPDNTYVWTSRLYDPWSAHVLSTEESSVFAARDLYRCVGVPIRPVFDGGQEVNGDQ